MADCNPICTPDKPNRYVGLRYVPLIDGEWVATKKYEPLTIVLYEGNSYTSKTFVPIGIVPTNETYWALTGNYNAQVEQYRQEVEQVKEDLETAETNLQNNINQVQTNLDTAENSLQTNINQVQNNLNATNQTVAGINTRVTKLETLPNYFVLGDSYGEGAGAGGTANGWPALLKKLLNVPDNRWFTLSRGSYGMCPEGKKFTSLGQELVATMSTEQKANVKYIIVGGGANDRTFNREAINTAIGDFRNFCLANFPNAEIHLFTLCWSRNNSYRTDYIYNVINGYSTITRFNNAFYHNCSKANHYYPYFTDDVHLSDYGTIAQCMAQSFKGGDMPLLNRFQTAQPISGNGLTGTITILQMPFGESYYTTLTGRITATGVTNFGQWGVYYPICDWPEIYMHSNSNGQFKIQVQGILRVSGQPNKVVPGNLGMANGKLNFYSANEVMNGDFTYDFGVNNDCTLSMPWYLC